MALCVSTASAKVHSASSCSADTALDGTAAITPDRLLPTLNYGKESGGDSKYDGKARIRSLSPEVMSIRACHIALRAARPLNLNAVYGREHLCLDDRSLPVTLNPVASSRRRKSRRYPERRGKLRTAVHVILRD